MLLVLKDGRELYPRLFGSLENPDVCEYITCQESGDDPKLDMFGQVELFKIHISQVVGFRGTYSIAPFSPLTPQKQKYV